MFKCENQFQLEQLVRWIQRQYKTGSSVIGGMDESSDRDYVALIEEFESVCEHIGCTRELATADFEEYALSFISFKYRTEDNHRWSNIILVESQADLEAWKFATSAVYNCPPSVKNDRKRRKTVFGWMLNQWYLDNDMPENAKWDDPALILEVEDA
jgi:hypothetical protein